MSQEKQAIIEWVGSYRRRVYNAQVYRFGFRFQVSLPKEVEMPVDSPELLLMRDV